MSHYYDHQDLARFADVGKDSPELWAKFQDWYSAVFAEGAYCIDAYTTGSLEKGATPDQMTEAVHVAAAIRGGASLVHGVQMRNRLERVSM